MKYFLKLFFSRQEFFWLRFCHFPLLLVYGKAEWQRIQCQIAAEIMDMSFANTTIVSFRQQKIFWIFV